MNHNISVRAATLQDADELLAIYAPYVTDTAITFEYETPSPEEFTERIRKILSRYPYLVAEKDDEILGYAYASAFHSRAAYDWCIETTVYVKQGKKHMGIGRMLYDTLEMLLKAQGVLNLNACIAYCDQEDEHLTNDSTLFHEKLGYRLVGKFTNCGYKFNRWYHMIWMEKLIGEHLEKQPPLKTFDEVRYLLD